MNATLYTVESVTISGAFPDTDLVVLTNPDSVIHVWIKQIYTTAGFPSEVILITGKKSTQMLANGCFFRLRPLDKTGKDYKAVKLPT